MKGHFVFEIGIFRALILFVTLFGAGVLAGRIWAAVESSNKDW